MKNKIFLVIVFSILFFGLVSCSSTMIDDSNFLPVKSGDFEIEGKIIIETGRKLTLNLFQLKGNNNDGMNEMLYFPEENLFGVSITNRNGDELQYKIVIRFQNEQSNVGEVMFVVRDIRDKNRFMRYSNSKSKIKVLKNDNVIEIKLFNDTKLTSSELDNIAILNGTINIEIE